MTYNTKWIKIYDTWHLTNFSKLEKYWLSMAFLKRKENFPYLFLKSMIFIWMEKHKEFCKVYYELYCSNCQKSMGTVRFVNINRLPMKLLADMADFYHSELSSIENSF